MRPGILQYERYGTNLGPTKIRPMGATAPRSRLQTPLQLRFHQQPSGLRLRHIGMSTDMRTAMLTGASPCTHIIYANAAEKLLHYDWRRSGTGCRKCC